MNRMSRPIRVDFPKIMRIVDGIEDPGSGAPEGGSLNPQIHFPIFRDILRAGGSDLMTDLSIHFPIFRDILRRAGVI